MTTQWRRARSCTVHFLNRVWAWSDNALDGVHASNQLIGLWWHGRPDGGDPQMQAALTRLERLHNRFVLIQVPCASARETLRAIGVPDDRIVLLPLGIDVRQFRPGSAADRRTVRCELGIPDDAWAVGSFQKDGEGFGDGEKPKRVKGPDVFVEAMIQLRERYPVHAVLPGPARGFVRSRLERAGVPCSAPGFVAHDRLAKLYHGLDLYMSPSRDEGGPAGVLEAMASGIPVVSTRTGMAPDVIQSGVNGALADIEDAAGLAARSAELIESTALRRTVAQNARATIEHYDWPLIAARYAAELYHPLLRKS